MRTYCAILLLLGFALMADAGVTNAPTELIVDGTPLTSWLTNYLCMKPELADRALAKVGTNAVPTLLWMLQQKNGRQNQAAYFAFLKLGARAQGAVPALIQIYESRITPFSRQCAASSIASVGSAGNSAIPVLIRGLGDSNVLVRCDTLLALGRLNSQPDLVVPTLTNALNDPVPKVRIFACMALGTVGERSKQAVLALREAAANDPDSNVRLSATGELHTLEAEAQMLQFTNRAKPPNTALEPTATAP
jgi:HEAT repeat protein